MHSSQNYQDHLILSTLKNFWGYDDFRESQKDIIRSVLAGKDTLALLPTGGGKSLCYQLPAMVLEGLCLVISPLLALMKDQVLRLQSLAIDAEMLSSELDDLEEESIFSRAKDGLIKILYVSPERLQNVNFLSNIQDINISFIAVDEAHCISEWGQDFRPSYENIKKFRSEFKKVPCLALTATATQKVVQEIIDKLALHQPFVYKKSFLRTNLNIITEDISNKYQKIYNFIQQNPYSGIIYTRTRKEAEDLASYLKSNQFSNVDYFHAGLPQKQKELIQKKWITSNSSVLVSTNAFGMGIDKDNVKFVIHLSPSATLENYYQEIGRAGRNGEESIALMLWNEPELINIQNILQNQIPTKQEYSKIITYLYSIFQIAEGDFSEKLFNVDLENLRKLTSVSTAKIKNVINFLHNQEIIYYKNTTSASVLQSFIKPDDIDKLPSSDAYFMEMLFRNLPGLAIQKVYFNENLYCEKNNIDLQNFKQKIKSLKSLNYLEYTDGKQHSIKFLKPRNEIVLFGKLWNVFVGIQKNKIQKWQELRFFIEDKSFCKMKLILTYFGEKNPENCGKCDVCRKRNRSTKTISSDILEALKNKPSSLEEVAAKLPFYNKQLLAESLIFLLDTEQVRMLDFRTYTIKNQI